MKRRFVSAVLIHLVAFVLATATSGCGSTRQSSFRLYDPTGEAATQVTRADVVRSSVRVLRDPAGQAVLAFAFTKHGASQFRALTRALARRGARLHRQQSFVVEIGGHVSARSRVDYEQYPDGLDGSSGVEIIVPRLATAQWLARKVRRG